MIMTIISNSTYKDGGTMVFEVSSYPSNMMIHVDHRISAKAKGTLGTLWCGYPESGRLLNDIEIEAFQRALDNYREYNQHIYERCVELFKERGYKKPANRVRMMDTICECGVSWWSMNSGLPDKVTCGKCHKIYPEYIYLRG